MADKEYIPPFAMQMIQARNIWNKRRNFTSSVFSRRAINKTLKTLCQIICSLKLFYLIQPVASNILILTTVLSLPSRFPGVFSCEDEIAHCQIFTFSHLRNATRDKFYLICLLFYMMNSLQLKGIIRTKIVLCLKLDAIWEWNIGHL